MFKFTDQDKYFFLFASVPLKDFYFEHKQYKKINYKQLRASIILLVAPCSFLRPHIALLLTAQSQHTYSVRRLAGSARPHNI